MRFPGKVRGRVRVDQKKCSCPLGAGRSDWFPASRTRRSKKRHEHKQGPLVAALLACGLAFGCAPGREKSRGEDRASPPAAITVSAAISLAQPLQEIQKLYARAKLTYNFGASGWLQQQIEQGAPVDVFFSAGENQMDALESEDLLIPGTRRNLLSNTMVLVAPRSATAVSSFADLARPQAKVVALGEPETVPAGLYAKQVLEHLGLLATVKRKAVYGSDVRQVLAYVETGDADAGLVYRTDALLSSRIRTVAEAPAGSHVPIVYPIAVVKSSGNVAAARAFVDFLGAPEARAVFQKYGFGIVKK